jgi:hypothetical protein
MNELVDGKVTEAEGRWGEFEEGRGQDREGRGKLRRTDSGITKCQRVSNNDEAGRRMSVKIATMYRGMSMKIAEGRVASKNGIRDGKVTEGNRRSEKVDKNKKKLGNIEEWILVEERQCKQGQSERRFIASFRS